MHELSPIATAHLFPAVTRELHRLLAALTDAEWNAAAPNGHWKVRDIAAHLLDGSLRRLSAHRDRYVADDARSQFESYGDLLGYLNRLNADWVAAARRLSPNVLLNLLEDADRQLGEDESKNWFDIARDYTEKWHHTQQLFETTGRASTILTRELMLPALDTFLRALPHAFRGVEAMEGVTVHAAVRGEFDGDWRIARENGRWSFCPADTGPATASITCAPRTMWKICTTRIVPDAAVREFPELRIAGNVALGAHVLRIVAVMI